MLDILLPPPPRDSGWESDDLDLYDLPDHVELIYGALQVMMSPQRSWHHQMMYRLRTLLEEVAEPDWMVEQGMTVRLDRRSRPEPDLLLVACEPYYNPNTRWFRPGDVSLVVEVESEESQARDRELKPIMYAQAGIPHYLRVAEGEAFAPILFHYRLDDGKYELVSEHRGRLVLDEPVSIDEEIRTTRRP